MFNKYHFISDTKDTILSELQNITDIQDFLHGIIENEIMYYYDCFEICKELNFTHFEHDIFGTCKDICQAAYCALYDLIYDESDILEYFEEQTNSITDEV
tara:strand:+ start:8651 stop:8950 length:300 start_codon:yes stop_codon:yes gene_type:complete